MAERMVLDLEETTAALRLRGSEERFKTYVFALTESLDKLNQGVTKAEKEGLFDANVITANAEKIQTKENFISLMKRIKKCAIVSRVSNTEEYYVVTYRDAIEEYNNLAWKFSLDILDVPRIRYPR